MQNPTPITVSVNTKPMVFHVDGKQVFMKRAYLCAGPIDYMKEAQPCNAEESPPLSFFETTSVIGFAMSLLSVALVFCNAVLDAVLRSPKLASIRLRSIDVETSVSTHGQKLDTRMVIYQAPDSFPLYTMKMFNIYIALWVVWVVYNSIPADVRSPKFLEIEPAPTVLPVTPNILLYRAISMMVRVYKAQQNTLHKYCIGPQCATASRPKLMTIDATLKVHLSPSVFPNAIACGPMRPLLPITNPATGMLTNLVVAY